MRCEGKRVSLGKRGVLVWHAIAVSGVFVKAGGFRIVAAHAPPMLG